VAIAAKYFAMAWEFQNGKFYSPMYQHWDQGPKLGSDMLQHTDQTQFEAYSTTLIRTNLGHILCHDGMWPFLPNISSGPGNFKMFDSFR
jgi:hypothetical protein